MDPFMHSLGEAEATAPTPEALPTGATAAPPAPSSWQAVSITKVAHDEGHR